VNGVSINCKGFMNLQFDITTLKLIKPDLDGNEYSLGIELGIESLGTRFEAKLLVLPDEIRQFAESIMSCLNAVAEGKTYPNNIRKYPITGSLIINKTTTIKCTEIQCGAFSQISHVEIKVITELGYFILFIDIPDAINLSTEILKSVI
jgi:hypothetical protein